MERHPTVTLWGFTFTADLNRMAVWEGDNPVPVDLVRWHPNTRVEDRLTLMAAACAYLRAHPELTQPGG